MVKGNWNGTSYEIINEEDTKDIIEKLSLNGIGDYDDEEKIKYIIYNNKSVMFCFSDYLEQQEHISSALEYFKNKDFEQDVINIELTCDFDREELYFGNEVLALAEVLKDNRITARNVNLKNFSINYLCHIKQTEKVKYLRKLLMLSVFANLTNIEENKFSFSFLTNNDFNDLIERTYDYSCIDNTEIEIMDSIYSWIFNQDNENKTCFQKINIVRNLIVRNGLLEFKDTFLDSAKSIYKRIINQDTDKYFEQVNQLKNDFLTIAERENTIYQSLHLKLMAWLAALGITIFDKIKDYEGQNVIQRLIESNSQKTILILGLLVGALFYIVAIYCIEVRKMQEEYSKLKRFYTESLLFEDNDFENKVCFPVVAHQYILTTILLMIILILRIFFIRCWFIIFTAIVLTVSFLFRKYLKILVSLINRKESDL
ncbi:hypothetical protein [Streptococcus pantholopis]|uniref:Uncharacterized protein n=1 Tax=Streptococcus pantholopis TaxID=1811193 RepID=A0A172Q9K3_9STRE|nr:hypothetical protein [Streptococcus pantholopis]AND80193.1 hypothetical protein A0O21_09385 [Streptococcus pantholopis]